MHVVIMGCGRVGSTLAQTLDGRGLSVSIIDQNVSAFRRLGPDFSGQTVTGMGFEPSVLREAGIERATAFAAVSSGDNSNIISARVARETFAVPKVVARIYDQRRAEVYERLGIPTVATVRWTADRMLRALLPEGHVELWRDATGAVGILEVPLHQSWIARQVRELEEATGARVAYLVRFGKAAVPTASTVIQEGDTVAILATDEIAEQAIAVAAAEPERGDH